MRYTLGFDWHRLLPVGVVIATGLSKDRKFVALNRVGRIL
jgi:hypothetical protein